VHEGVVKLVDDLMVHRPAIAGADEARWRSPSSSGGRVIPALDPSGWAGEYDFRHLLFGLNPCGEAGRG